MTLRIAFYVPQAHYLEPGYSGDHVFSRNLVAALENRGHQVRVVSQLDPGDFARGRISTRRLVAEALSVRREMRRFAPDAWLVYAPSDERPDLFGWWQQPKRYVLLSAVAHAPKGRRFSGDWRRALLGFVHRCSLSRAGSITVFRHVSADRLRCSGVADRRLHLLPPAAVAWKWIPSREQARHRLGLPEKAPIILCAGRFSERKVGGPSKTDMMLDLIAAVATLPSNVVLVLVGDGSGRQRLEEAARQLEGRVRFPGLVEHNEMKWYYAACDLYAYPHRKDQSWLSVMEAQYCGRPVVTMRTRAGEFTVDDGRTGLLAKDLEEFRSRLAILVSDRSRREGMGAAAQDYIARFHSIETRLRQVEGLLIG